MILGLHIVQLLSLNHITSIDESEAITYLFPAKGKSFYWKKTKESYQFNSIPACQEFGFPYTKSLYNATTPNSKRLNKTVCMERT